MNFALGFFAGVALTLAIEHWLSHEGQKQNTEEHQQIMATLQELTDAVNGLTSKVDTLATTVTDEAQQIRDLIANNQANIPQEVIDQLSAIGTRLDTAATEIRGFAPPTE